MPGQNDQIKLLATSLSFILNDDLKNENGSVIATAGTRAVLVPLTTTRGVMHGSTSLEDLWDTLSKSDHTHGMATTTTPGFMSALDKAKLDSVSASGSSTPMIGASADSAGAVGLVPAPAAGDQALFLRGDGTWALPPDMNSITGIKGDAESSYRTGDVNITAANVGAAASDHVHGDISSDGKVGTVANKPLITTTGGKVATGSFGTSANTFCEGNDSRLSDARTPVAHNHAASDITSGTFDTARIPSLAAGKITSGTFDAARIPALDASKITSGTIDIARLPAAALERLVTVTDETARKALTTSSVQVGDTVKETDTGKMYRVVDDTKLDSDDGYVEYTVGSAASVPWSGVTGKPSTYTPASHTHDYLPLSGGTLSGNIIFKRADYTRGTAPSSNAFFEFIDVKDSDNRRFSLIETAYYPDKSSMTRIYAYNTTAATGGNIGSMGIGCDSSGNVYTTAPTPATADNSTKIATTAFVKAQGYITGSGSITGSSGSCTGNAATATKFASSQSVALTGDVTGSASSQAGWSVATTLANSGVTAGSYGPSDNATPGYGATFNVPYITVDAKGRVTACSTKTVKIPASDNTNTDTLMTQNVSTSNSTYPILLCATANATANQGAKTGIFGSGIKANPSTSEITATKFLGALQADKGTGSYVNSIKLGAALVNSSQTQFGAIWNAPVKEYRVACATFPSNDNKIYWYSITNANVTNSTNTTNKIMAWDAGTGALTATSFVGNASSATEFSAAKSVTLTGDVTGTASSKAGWSVAATLANSGVTAGNYGPSANASPAHSGTFSVPYITVDAKGRVTAASTKTITLPASGNTNWTSHLYAGGSGATANAATTNGGTYLSICDNSTSRNSIKITGSGATTVTSDANGVITINSTDTNTDTNTHYTTTAYVGASNTKSNAATSNGGTYLKIYDDNTRRAEFKITGSGATTVSSDASGNITISSTDNNTDTHYTSHLYAGASNGNANAATTNGNTYLILCDNTTARDRRLIKGTGATTVTSDANGVITINSTDTNTQTITGVKGNSESSYRTGNVNLTAANIGAAASSHTHSYLPIDGSGVLTNPFSIKSPTHERAVLPSSDQWIQFKMLDKNLANVGAVNSVIRAAANTNLAAQQEAGTASTALYVYEPTSTGSGHAVLLFATPSGKYGLACPETIPSKDNDSKLGNGSYRWKQLYASTATINTSDEREKSFIGAIPDEVLDAWEGIQWIQYKFNNSIEEKGDSARYHVGMIAQQADRKFNECNLNASDYGFFCYDGWEEVECSEDVLIEEAEYEDQEVIDEATGETHIERVEVKPAKYETRSWTRPAGGKYSLRYEEALCMEAAYQRRRADRLEARVEDLASVVLELQDRLAALENK